MQWLPHSGKFVNKAPFARYVIDAARRRDQHVIVIVLTCASPTGSRLVGNSYTPPSTRRHQTTPNDTETTRNATKNVTGRNIALVLLSIPFFELMQSHQLHSIRSWMPNLPTSGRVGSRLSCLSILCTIRRMVSFWD